jgi:hypothetical protein
MGGLLREIDRDPITIFGDSPSRLSVHSAGT